jgi:hypothetical protein
MAWTWRIAYDARQVKPTLGKKAGLRMSWWKRFLGVRAAPSSTERPDAVRLAMQGWNEEATSDDMRVWRDSQGSVLSLSVLDTSLGLPEISDESALRRWCRQLAESRHGGLIEVRVVTGVLGVISDDECYDECFPEHPLSIVRGVLAALPYSVQVVPRSSD